MCFRPAGSSPSALRVDRLSCALPMADTGGTGRAPRAARGQLPPGRPDRRPSPELSSSTAAGCPLLRPRLAPGASKKVTGEKHEGGLLVREKGRKGMEDSTRSEKSEDSGSEPPPGLFVGIRIRESGWPWPPRLVQTPVARPALLTPQVWGGPRSCVFTKFPGDASSVLHFGNTHTICVCVCARAPILRKANAPAFFVSSVSR